MSHFYIRTPFGLRPVSEFTYGGEVRPAADPNGTELDEIRRLWMRRNACGIQKERWFHAHGTRRWYTIVRDTRTNLVLAHPGEDYVEGDGESR